MGSSLVAYTSQALTPYRGGGFALFRGGRLLEPKDDSLTPTRMGLMKPPAGSGMIKASNSSVMVGGALNAEG